MLFLVLAAITLLMNGATPAETFEAVMTFGFGGPPAPSGDWLAPMLFVLFSSAEVFFLMAILTLTILAVLTVGRLLVPSPQLTAHSPHKNS